MSRIILLNKPCGVLTQFTSEGGQRTLKELVDIPGFYPAGRLDKDSEGLVVLTDDGALQARISQPRHKLAKEYWVQVEGLHSEAALNTLAGGIDLGDFVTAPCAAVAMPEPEGLWSRDPPVRFRMSIPTSWIKITLKEGKNRQVRRMTAHVGLPTLRLIRWAVGPWSLAGLAPGQWRALEIESPLQGAGSTAGNSAGAQGRLLQHSKFERKKRK